MRSNLIFRCMREENGEDIVVLIQNMPVWAGWSEALLVAHTTLLENPCRGSNFVDEQVILAEKQAGFKKGIF